MSPTTEFGHSHGRTCYWDHLACGWVCAPVPAEVVVVDVPVVEIAEPPVAAEPLPA